ncbi:MAG: hypothetical protein AB7D28_11930 [Candidatus Berkiella sp.]
MKKKNNPPPLKRVFARLISREIASNDLEKVSGGNKKESGWYWTNTEKFKGYDCCK